jgi:hypothetical protein
VAGAAETAPVSPSSSPDEHPATTANDTTTPRNGAARMVTGARYDAERVAATHNERRPGPLAVGH